MANPKTVITITHSASEAYQTIKDRLLKDASRPKEELRALRNFFHAAIGGDRDMKCDVQVNSGSEVKASATVTVASNAAGDTAVVSGTTFTAVDHRETSNLTFAADSSGSLNSKYFTFQDQSGAYKYYMWFSINNLGVDPAPAGRVGIKIIGATGASAATLATAAVTATAGTTSAKVTFGADSAGSLNNKYFLFSDSAGINKYAFWFNINNAGVAPSLPGYTLIQVAGATNASAATLATAAYTAASALSLSNLRVVNSASGVINIFGNDGLAAIVKDGPSVATATQFVMVQALQGVVISAGASAHIIVTDSVAGVATATLDGPATSTGFTFTRSITGSAVTSVQYNIAATDTLAAANLAAAINANAAMANVVTASSAAAVVTVSSFYPGPIGNYITLTATSGNTASGSTLSLGALSASNSAVVTYHSGV